MKKIGYLLIAGAFLAASLVAVLEVTTVKWGYFAPLFLLGFAGVGVVQYAIRKQATAKHTVTANIETIHRALENVVKHVTELNNDKANINVYELRHLIDDRILGDLDDFVEVRESIGHKYGLQAYADVMSHYAAGERYLNRVWSTSADGYVDEANTYLDKSVEQFVEAFDQLKKLEASHA